MGERADGCPFNFAPLPFSFMVAIFIPDLLRCRCCQSSNLIIFRSRSRTLALEFSPSIFLSPSFLIDFSSRVCSFFLTSFHPLTTTSTANAVEVVATLAAFLFLHDSASTPLYFAVSEVKCARERAAADSVEVDVEARIFAAAAAAAAAGAALGEIKGC